MKKYIRTYVCITAAIPGNNFVLKIEIKRAGIVVTLLTYIPILLVSNPGQDTAYPDISIRVFLQSLQISAGTVPPLDKICFP
jgi:hypothetical protein